MTQPAVVKWEARYFDGLAMPDDLVAHNLRIGVFRFTIAPVQSLEVPAVNKGNMLRGGFGHAFRRLCCVPQCKDTKTCPLATSCPYKAVFEPSPPPGADRLSKNQDIPRPFVFRAPQTQQTRFEPGQRFEFGLVLIGRALDFLPYFVLSFRELAAGGLGLNRAKCNLERVEQIKTFPNGAGLQDCQTEAHLHGGRSAISSNRKPDRGRVDQPPSECFHRKQRWCHPTPHNSICDAYAPTRGWRGHPSP